MVGTVTKSYPFATLFWVNKDVAQQIFQAHRIIGFSQLLKINLLSETIYSQTEPAFICSNLAIITVEESA